MASSSLVVLTGYLGQDPELKSTNGDPVCNFSMATSKKIKDEEQTTWWRVAVWGKQGEACEKYLRKGSLVEVIGLDVNLRMYESKGKTGASLEVTATRVIFLDRKEGGKEERGGTGGSGSGRDDPPPRDDDNLPF